MRLYSNVYDYAKHALNYYEDKYFIIFFARILKYMYDENTYD